MSDSVTAWSNIIRMITTASWAYMECQSQDIAADVTVESDAKEEIFFQ